MSPIVKRQQMAAAEQREEGFRNLVETACLAARRQTQPALHKAGNEVANHREAADDSPDLPFEADQRRPQHRRQHRKHDPADRFRAAEERPPVDKRRIAVERMRKPPAEDLLGHNRRAVGQRQ